MIAYRGLGEADRARLVDIVKPADPPLSRDRVDALLPGVLGAFLLLPAWFAARAWRRP